MPNAPRFYEALVNNARKKWRFYRGEAPFELTVEPRFHGLPTKEFSTFKRTFITGWYGDYRLEGTPEVLDMLYQTGLGAKNSEGFGMFEVSR